MKIVKKLMVVCIILTSCLIFTACWNYREINELNIISGFFIDVGEKGYKYSITAEVLAPKLVTGKNIIKSRFIESQGDTIFKAIRNIAEVDGKKAYSSHAKVMIISKAVAEQGLISVIDFIYRNPEPRSDVHIIIADMSETKQIFKLYGEDVSIRVDEILGDESQITTYKSVDLRQYLNALNNEGISPVAPIIYLSEIGGKKMPRIGGLAVFKFDKMIGKLSAEETEFFSLINPKIKGGLLVINNEACGSLVKVNLRILSGKTTVEPVYVNGSITMKINIIIDVVIGEIGGSEDFITKGKRGELEKNAENHIEQGVSNLIRRVQEQYDSDIFGFGNAVKNSMPDLWKNLKNNWDEEFKNLKFKTAVSVNIKTSGLTSGPIKVGE
jgi:spore germination protein KC